MDRNSGWVELLAAEEDAVLGRGLLLITIAPGGPADEDGDEAAEPRLGARGQVEASDGAWEGRLDPLRLEADARAIAAGERFRIRFERNHEVLPILLRSWEAVSDADADDLDGAAEIESADGVLPAVVLEVGGE